MKKNFKNFVSLSSGAAIVLESLVSFAKSNTAADVMYYITRVFGVALPLFVAIPLRVALLTLGGYNLLSSIKELAPQLYSKIVNCAVKA